LDDARQVNDSSDDNFASIVSAIEEGRGVFDNIKSLLYIFASTPEAVPFILFAVQGLIRSATVLQISPRSEPRSGLAWCRNAGRVFIRRRAQEEGIIDKPLLFPRLCIFRNHRSILVMTGVSIFYMWLDRNVDIS
jgi:magnesium-transporting ATPase (P-type)